MKTSNLVPDHKLKRLMSSWPERFMGQVGGGDRQAKIITLLSSKPGVERGGQVR